MRYLVCILAIWCCQACYEPTYNTELLPVNHQNEVLDASNIKFYLLTTQQLTKRGGTACLPPNYLGKCNAIELIKDIKMYRSGKNELTAGNFHLFAVKYRGRVPYLVGYRQINISNAGNSLHIKIGRN